MDVAGGSLWTNNLGDHQSKRILGEYMLRRVVYDAGSRRYGQSIFVGLFVFGEDTMYEGVWAR